MTDRGIHLHYRGYRTPLKDSDDGVNYSDRAVTNPFSKEEFYHFQMEMESLHIRYHNAKQTNFQSAQGKYFFSLLTKILTLDFRRMDSLHSIERTIYTVHIYHIYHIYQVEVHGQTLILK